MKLRTDYVTNSSSSSFVITYKKMPEIQTEDVNVKRLLNFYTKTINKVFSDNETEIIKTAKELEEYYVSNYGWSRANTLEKILGDDEYLKEKFENELKQIKNGYSIAFREVDNYDETFRELLHSLHDGENIFVKEGC